MYYKSSQPKEPLIKKLIMPEISYRITPFRQQSNLKNPVILRDYMEKPSPVSFNRLLRDPSVKKMCKINEHSTE